MLEFRRFLNKAYLDWVNKLGKVESQNKFAQWLGVSAGSLSQWMNGSRLPVGENVHTLAEKLGPEVYDILGMPRMMPKDNRMNYIAEKWVTFTELEKDAVYKFVQDLDPDPNE